MTIRGTGRVGPIRQPCGRQPWYGRRMGLQVVGPEPIPFPMRFMKVEGELSSSGGGSLTVEQVYQNTMANQAELEFLFDAPGLSIASFTAIVDGKTLRGEIREKEAAADDYDDAIAQGCRGALVEKKETAEGEVFSLSMGSLKPGASITVQLRLVAKMESLCGISGSTTTLTLPITACGHFLPPPPTPSDPTAPTGDATPAVLTPDQMYFNQPKRRDPIAFGRQPGRPGPGGLVRTGQPRRHPPVQPEPVAVAQPPPAPPAPIWEGKWEGPEGLEVCLAVECSGKIKSAACPSHPLLNSQFSGGRLFVTTQDPLALSRATSPSPLRIEVETTEPPTSTASLSVLPDPTPAPTPAGTEDPPKEGRKEEGKGPGVGWSYLPKAGEIGKYAVTATFRPTIVPLDREPEDSWMGRELLFIVDRSGSMKGEKIEQVRGALQLFLRSIPEGCTFNILGFGTRFDSVFRCYQPYTAQSMEVASRWVQRMQADLGGTDIMTPLANMLARPEAKAGELRLPREVFVLTDGNVKGKQQVIQYVRNNTSHDTRLWALGIGAEANTRLVSGMALAGNGGADFTQPGERVQPKVLAQLDRALKPALTALTVDWGDLKVADRMGAEGRGVKDGYPMGPLFEGQVATVQAILSELPAKPATITLTGLRGSEPFVCKVEVTPGEAQATPAPHILCAQRAISQLERLVSKGEAGPAQAGLKSIGSTISRSFGLVSAFTSYIAVEDSPSLQMDSTQGPSTKYSANTGLQPASHPQSVGRPGSGRMNLESRAKSEGLRKKRCKMAEKEAPLLFSAGPAAAPFPCSGAAAPKGKAADLSDMEQECDDADLDGCMAQVGLMPQQPEKQQQQQQMLGQRESLMFLQRDLAAGGSARRAPIPTNRPHAASTSTSARSPAAGGRGGGVPQLRRNAAVKRDDKDSYSRARRASSTQSSLSPSMSPLEAVVSRQGADGGFHLDHDLLSAMGLSAERVEEELSTWGEGRGVVETVIVVAYLHARLGDQVIEWKLLANKARRFIAKALPLESSNGTTTLSSADQSVAHFTQLFFN